MTAGDVWTAPKLVKWITDDLSSRGIQGFRRLEAEQLVAHALGISRLDIYLLFDKPCSEEEQAAVRELVVRRRRREPMSYIMESCDFRSLTLAVGQGVLTPRPETELLVEKVLELLREGQSHGRRQILELGTGTAAIPLSLAMEEDNLVITATEISPGAMAFAGRNVERYRKEIEKRKCRIDLVQMDGFRGINSESQFDCIVSNPPYIRSGDISGLQEEVRDWEPVGALDGGADGLDFYRYLKKAAVTLLKPGGFLVCEHGFDQRKDIEKLVVGEELGFYQSTRDYAGHDRILTFQKKKR